LARRSRTTSNKRQKEQARLEKQRAKAQRKMQRKLETPTVGPFAEKSETAPQEHAISQAQPHA